MYINLYSSVRALIQGVNLCNGSVRAYAVLGDGSRVPADVAARQRLWLADAVALREVHADGSEITDHGF